MYQVVVVLPLILDGLDNVHARQNVHHQSNAAIMNIPISITARRGDRDWENRYFVTNLKFENLSGND